MQMTGFDLTQFIHGEEPAPVLSAFSHTGVARAENLQRRAREFGRKLDFFTGDKAEETWVALREKDLVLKYRNMGGGKWKFLAYDLAVDPTEDRNIFDPADATHRSTARRLERYKAELERAYSEWEARRDDNSRDELSEEELRQLRSLGYIQ